MAAIRAYLTHVLNGPVSDTLVETVHRRSDGIPFYFDAIVEPLVAAGEFHQDGSGKWQYTRSRQTRPLTRQLVRLFERRLVMLSAKTRELLAAAAAIGPEFEFSTWLAVLGGDSQAPLALNALDEALGSRTLRDAGQDRFRFHPVDIARVAAGSLSGPRRRYLHQRIAETLVSQERDPTLIAYHYQQADVPAAASHYLEAAGVKAWLANATRQAVARYERAVALAPSRAAYEILGVLYEQRSLAASVRAFRQALEMAKGAGDRESQAHILNSLSRVLCLYDRPKEAYQAATAVLKLPAVPAVERAIAQSNMGLCCWYVGRLVEAEQWCTKALTGLLGEKEGEDLASVYSKLGMALFARGKYSQAMEAIERALEIRRRLDDPWKEKWCWVNLAQVHIDQGEFAEAGSLLDSAQRLFARAEYPLGLLAVYAYRSRALVYQGSAAEALPLLDKAQDLATELGQKHAPGGSLTEVHLLRAQADLLLGQLGRGWTAVEDAKKLAVESGNQRFLAMATATLAQILERAPRKARAEVASTYTAALSLFEKVGDVPGLLRTKLAYARFLAPRDEVGFGARLEREARQMAAEIGLYIPR